MNARNTLLTGITIALLAITTILPGNKPTARADALSVVVVTSCGAQSLTAGQFYPAYMDATGKLCDSGGGGGGGGGPITAPLGPTTAPSAAVSVVLPDEVNACTGGNTCTVTSAATLATVDMTGYASLSWCVTANASANTITTTQSDDNTNYVAAGFQSTNLGSVTGIFTTAATAVTCYQINKKQRYIKFAVTTFVAGTTTITIELHQNKPADNLSTALAVGTSTIGKTGPGFTSLQTPVSVSANGTTGAVTATMAAVAAKTNWMCGFSVRAAATAATTGSVTITGILGGTMTFQEYIAPIATGMVPVEPPLGHVCISGSATNTAIVLTAPAPGTGGINSANIWGYVE